MTATLDTSVDPTARRMWRAGRVPALIALLVLLTGVAIAAAGSQTDSGRLDPRAVDDSGSRAVAQLLREQGVQVDLVRSNEEAAAAGAAATLLVAFPDRLTDAQLGALRRGPADLVLLAPGNDVLRALAPGVQRGPAVNVQTREAGCQLPAARAAGRADTGGDTYRVAGTVTRCFAAEPGPTVVQVQSQGRTVTVLGASTLLTNDAIDDAGNAALALGLLGARPRLVWFLPSLAELPAGGEQSFTELIPRGWLWGAAQLGIAVALLALWRARRLGPVVAEPLPVVVRAAEAVEGRSRLYRRAGATGRAAEQLRTAARRRLLPMLGMPRRSAPAAIVDAVAARTGRAGADVGVLLYGAAPVGDAELVRLADALDAVLKEVRRS